jgi:hypothetical protein
VTRTSAPAATTGRETRGRTPLRALQVLASLSVLSLLWQFVTAGQLFPRGGPEEMHSWGAVVLHVLTGAAAVAAAWHARSTGGPWWPAVLAAVVFALTFVQASVGGRDTLWIHVPGAMVLTVGAVWLLAWSVTAGRRRATG